jgi:GNAT superfamily N-acetyltransferase
VRREVDVGGGEWFADLELARRLEAADAWFKAAYAEAQAALCPEVGAAVEAVGGGYAVYAGAGSPLNRAVGLGMSGPVSTDELQRAEAFFHSRGAAAWVDLCPLADPSLLAWLDDRGYRLAEFKNVWARPLRRGESFPLPPPGVQVRVAGPEEAELWIRTVSRGFAGREELRPEDLEIATPNFYMSGGTCFLAWVDGEPAGGGAMATCQGLAAFFSASTRPALRGRGVQTALLHARLAAAAAAGCDLATVQTAPGNASGRNVERCGFRLAYTKVALVREV